MNCEQRIGTALLKWFCAVTEILNEYNVYVGEIGANTKENSRFKEFSEDMSKKLLDSFKRVKEDIVENVKMLKNEDSLSFSFSDCSNSPSPCKNKLAYNTPPSLILSLIETQDLKYNTQKQSRLKKINFSNDLIAKNLFKT
jgi:hypothetical protein